MKFLALRVLYVLASGSGAVFAQTLTKEETTNPQSQVTSDVLKKLDQLVQQNKQLETQNHELVAEIKSLRQLLATAGLRATNIVERRIDGQCQLSGCAGKLSEQTIGSTVWASLARPGQLTVDDELLVLE